MNNYNIINDNNIITNSITTQTNTGGGGVRFITGDGRFFGDIGADIGWVYVNTTTEIASQGIYLAAIGICRLASNSAFVEFYVNNSQRGTVLDTLMDMKVPITSTSKIKGTSLEAPTHIFIGPGPGTGTPSITSYNLTLPTGLATIANTPLISTTSGLLQYNDQALLKSSNVEFNSGIISNIYIL